MTPRTLSLRVTVKKFGLVYKPNNKWIMAHESIATNPKYTSVLRIYGLWPFLGCLS